MQVKLLHWTGTLEPMYFAARNCYSETIPEQSLTEELMATWLQDKVIGRGHTSLREHVDFHFATFKIKSIRVLFIAIFTKIYAGFLKEGISVNVVSTIILMANVAIIIVERYHYITSPNSRE
jgi:hypothetical protein